MAEPDSAVGKGGVRKAPCTEPLRCTGEAYSDLREYVTICVNAAKCTIGLSNGTSDKRGK